MRKPYNISKKAWEWRKHHRQWWRPEGKRMANKSERATVKRNLKEVA